MAHLLFEDMIRAETDRHVCRIWRQVDDTYDGASNSQIKHLAIEMLMQHYEPIAIVTSLAKHARVNSVEVIDRKSGDGVCVHVDWP